MVSHVIVTDISFILMKSGILSLSDMQFKNNYCMSWIIIVCVRDFYS